MKIAISGAHGQGKTTLVNDLKVCSEFRKFSFLTNITRSIKEGGIEINEKGSDWSQSLVVAKHIEYFFIKGNAILDRCILDGVVYSKVLYEDNKIDKHIMDYAEYVFSQLINQYAVIFYVVPELPIENDNVRSTDREFFDRVVSTFNYYIEKYNISVVLLRGSREERTKVVINTLKEKNLFLE